MRHVDPGHRYKALKARRLVPETELERSLYVAIHGPEELTRVTPQRPWQEGQEVDPSFTYPYEVFLVPATRATMEAFLLSSEDNYEIGEALAMAADEVSAYRHLFFDTSVFKSELELIVFMRSVPEDHPFKDLYRIALHQGLGALRWHYCRNKEVPKPEEVVKTLMMDAFFRSMEHRGLPLTSKMAKEASRHARMAMECARVMLGESDGPQEDIGSLRMQFEEVRKNRTIDDIDDKVLH